jgi:hypothetical protein
VTDAALPAVPVEILLPRTRRHATPLTWILGGGGAILLILGLLVLSGRSGRTPGAPPAGSAATPVEGPATPAPPVPGPLDALEPDLRSAVEATLSDYAHALETADADALARARPDLHPDAVERRLRPYRGALNAAADLRVIDARVLGAARAEVELLATDIVVGAAAAPRASQQETLVYERTPNGWSLLRR